MTPYTFTQHDARRISGANPSSRRTLRFYGKNIYPSALLADMLCLEAGCHVAVTLDEDSPSHIYIRRADDRDDNDRTQTATVTYDCKAKNTFAFSAVAVVRYILELVKANKTATLYVSPRPVIINNKKYYRILTESPITKI